MGAIYIGDATGKAKKIELGNGGNDNFIRKRQTTLNDIALTLYQKGNIILFETNRIRTPRITVSSNEQLKATLGTITLENDEIYSATFDTFFMNYQPSAIFGIHLTHQFGTNTLTFSIDGYAYQGSDGNRFDISDGDYIIGGLFLFPISD